MKSCSSLEINKTSTFCKDLDSYILAIDAYAYNVTRLVLLIPDNVDGQPNTLHRWQTRHDVARALVSSRVRVPLKTQLADSLIISSTEAAAHKVLARIELGFRNH